MELEEIHNFASPGELFRFQQFLANGIAAGELREIAPDSKYHSGEISGGRWFALIKDNSVWRLIEPDPPFTGMFERVRRVKSA